MIYGNPVKGYIYPLSWKRPSGSHAFKITQGFGCTGYAREPALGSCKHYHRGIDIANGREGDPVLATGSGTVHFAGTLNDGAKAVIIDHGGGNFSNSGHLSAITISKGQHVSKGQQIGKIGCTGNCSGPHDHYAIKSGMDGSKSFFLDTNGKWLNPMDGINRIRIKDDGINIRSTPGSGDEMGPIYATTRGGKIVRNGKAIVSRSSWLPWGNDVSGASWTVPGASGTAWAKIWIASAWRYVAIGLVER